MCQKNNAPTREQPIQTSPPSILSTAPRPSAPTKRKSPSFYLVAVSTLCATLFLASRDGMSGYTGSTRRLVPVAAAFGVRHLGNGKGRAAVPGTRETLRFFSSRKQRPPPKIGKRVAPRHAKNMARASTVREGEYGSVNPTTDGNLTSVPKRKKDFVSFFDAVDDQMKQRQEQSKSPLLSSGSAFDYSGPLGGDDRLSSGEGRNRRPDDFFERVDMRMERLKDDNKNKDNNNHPIPQNIKSSVAFRPNSSTETPTPSSIFDTPPQKQKDGSNSTDLFPPHEFSEYQIIMEELLSSRRFLRNKKKNGTQEDQSAVAAYILNPRRTLPIDLPSLSAEKPDPKQFRKELQTQHNNFIESCTDLKSPRQREIALRALVSLGDFCAKRSYVGPLKVAWEKMKEGGFMPREESISTYLYVVSNEGSMGGFWGDAGDVAPSKGATGSILDMIKEPGDKDSLMFASRTKNDMDVDIPNEVAIFHDLLFKPTEKSISLRVKSLVAKGDAVGAERLLDTLEETGDGLLKLRTYLPILKLYCSQSNIPSALSLFSRMQSSPTTILETATYILILATMAESGIFHPNYPHPCKEAHTIYNATHGPKLFDAMAKQAADNVLDITGASAKRLYNAFAQAFPEALPVLPSLAGMLPHNEPSMNDNLVVSRVHINGSTAVCPNTRVKLRLISLKEEEKQVFYEGLINLSGYQFVKFVSAGAANMKVEGEGDVYAEEQLRKFATWLDDREGAPFTAIIDGANIGYWGQNFEGGRFNYHQIQFLVDALEKNHENPLVIIPSKYASKSFYSNTGPSKRRQVLGPKEFEILEGLNNTGKLYTVPPRCLDDYYWMLASVSNQTTSRQNNSLTVPPNEPNGRLPGKRPMLLSNDQMRDHKMELIEPRLFRRWVSSHIVNYNFTSFVEEECVDKEIGFEPPDFFSREIQGNPTESGAMAWHFPVSDWDVNERLVIKIPSV